LPVQLRLLILLAHSCKQVFIASGIT